MSDWFTPAPKPQGPLHNHPHTAKGGLHCPRCEADWIEKAFPMLEFAGWLDISRAPWKEPCANLRDAGWKIKSSGAYPPVPRKCGTENCCQWLGGERHGDRSSTHRPTQAGRSEGKDPFLADG
jgi:hypothetical protein